MRPAKGWTWLHNGANGIRKNDHLILIKKLKGLVYASSDNSLESSYNQLVQMCPEAMRYPHFMQHLQLVWEKRCEWAHCYRSNLPLRGNHTNNCAEAGVQISPSIHSNHSSDLKVPLHIRGRHPCRSLQSIKVDHKKFVDAGAMKKAKGHQ